MSINYDKILFYDVLENIPFETVRKDLMTCFMYFHSYILDNQFTFDGNDLYSVFNDCIERFKYKDEIIVKDVLMFLIQNVETHYIN